MSWFRPVYQCADSHDLWINVWDWIGKAHAMEWYPEAGRVQRLREWENFTLRQRTHR